MPVKKYGTVAVISVLLLVILIMVGFQFGQNRRERVNGTYATQHEAVQPFPFEEEFFTLYNSQRYYHYTQDALLDEGTYQLGRDGVCQLTVEGKASVSYEVLFLSNKFYTIEDGVVKIFMQRGDSPVLVGGWAPDRHKPQNP